MALSIDDFAFDYEQFDFAHLRKVIPIAQTATLGDVTLTLMSLELYEAGFAAILLFEQVTETTASEGFDTDSVVLFRGMPAISAHDDRGNRYEGRMRAGYGGGGSQRHKMSDVHNFSPALDPDARHVTLDVIFVTRLGGPAGKSQWSAEDVVAGPWSASFSLPEDK